MKYKAHSISNVEELRLEIVRLKVLAKAQETYLETQYDIARDKIAAPVRIVNKFISWIPGVDLAKEILSSSPDNAKKDWMTRLFSVGSAALLNRLFLRRAGLLKRIILTTLTQQAAGFVSQDRASSILKTITDTVTNFVVPPAAKRQKRRQKYATEAPAGSPDFGIPPDSEAS